MCTTRTLPQQPNFGLEMDREWRKTKNVSEPVCTWTKELLDMKDKCEENRTELLQHMLEGAERPQVVETQGT